MGSDFYMKGCKFCKQNIMFYSGEVARGGEGSECCGCGRLMCLSCGSDLCPECNMSDGIEIIENRILELKEVIGKLEKIKNNILILLK